jgi:hypothetical protein
MKINATTKRNRNQLNNETNLIDKFKQIYEKEGIKGLTPTFLDKNYITIYNTYIRKNKEYYSIDKKNKKKGINGCPSYWICEKLNILEDRENYLNEDKYDTQKTDEELLEIIKNDDTLKVLTQICLDDYTNEIRVLQNRGYTINYFRKLLNFPLNDNTWPSRDGKFIFKSKAEYKFYEELIKYDGIKEIKYEVKIYKFNKKCSCDFVVELENDKKIAIEIWRNSENVKSTLKGKDDYVKRRKEKENEMATNQEYIFKGLEWNDTTSKKYIDFIINELELTINDKFNNNIELTPILRESDDEKFRKEMMDIYYQNGYLDFSLVNNSQQHKIQRDYGGNINGVREWLGIDIKENKKISRVNKIKNTNKTKEKTSYDKVFNKCKIVCDNIKNKDIELTPKIFENIAKENNIPNPRPWLSTYYNNDFIEMMQKFIEEYPEYNDIKFSKLR